MGAVTKAVQKVGEKTGLVKPKEGITPISTVVPGLDDAIKKAAQTGVSGEREEILARRRARRGGRALLSEQRLAPETGVGQSTLGAGPMA
jgi:hypothetical protein